MNPSIEWMTYLAESCIKVGLYEESRKYSKEVITNKSTDIHFLYINRAFIVTSYFLEGNIIQGEKELEQFLTYWTTHSKQNNAKITQDIWVFNGLVHLIESKPDLSLNSVIMNLIDLLRGKGDKEEMLVSLTTFSSVKKMQVIDEYQRVISEAMKELNTVVESSKSKDVSSTQDRSKETYSDDVRPNLRSLIESEEKLRSIVAKAKLILTK
jgi:hypothetical protein